MKIAVVCDNKTDYAYPDCEVCFFSSIDRVTVDDWSLFDAVFLLAPYGENAVISWTGHPHLRAVNSAEELTEELDVLFGDIELEKKFLIRYPDFSALEKYHPFKSDIEQIYLTCLNGSHRIRKRVSNGRADYFETLKIRITTEKCHEMEQRIDAETYEELKKRAEPKKHPIIKSRYCFLYEGQYFELDTYDFWSDRATLEIELKSDDQPFTLPPEVTVIKDVSNNHRYKNSHLAGIPYEDYQTKIL